MFPFDDREVHCVRVPVTNTASCADTILYLMKRRINFYLSREGDAVVPKFCDCELAFGEEGVSMRTFDEFNAALEPGAGWVILSSSGTTGRPKYVCYRGDDLTANASHCIGKWGLSAGSKVLIPVPLGHMYGLGAGLLPAILAGGSVSLIDKSNVVKLIERLSQYQPDLTLINPTLCKMLIRLNKPLSFRGNYIAAGERLSPSVYAEFTERFGRLINLYGCTEMGAMASSEDGSAFTALPGVAIRVDGEGEGELLCRTTDGFAFYLDESGHRSTGDFLYGDWYRTKDLGERMEDGRIKVIGRIDHCVNRSGFLVSLQEVEMHMEGLFGELEQLIVVETEEETIQGRKLIAFCHVKPGQVLTAENMRLRCSGDMPRHTIPDAFHFVDVIPRLKSGKPDRIFLTKNYTSVIQNSL